MLYRNYFKLNDIIDREKKNVTICSCIILLAGIIQHIFIWYTQIASLFIIIPFITGSLYILTGAIGIISGRNNTGSLTSLYMGLLVAIICIDLIILTISVVVIVFIAENRLRCKDCIDDTGITIALYYIFGIAAIISLISLIYIKLAHSMAGSLKKSYSNRNFIYN